jgi:hypothetical protein
MLSSFAHGDRWDEMYVPLVVEKVRIRGSEELFLVTRIDWHREKAHLVSLKLTTDLAYDVPFSDIFPIGSIIREQTQTA